MLDEVYQNGGLERVSLLDPRAAATIAQAFETHNWVKSTTRVSKSTGGLAAINLIYRRPAAMVYYQDQPADSEITRGFYPVDDDGFILPTQDFDTARVTQHFGEGLRAHASVFEFGQSRAGVVFKSLKQPELFTSFFIPFQSAQYLRCAVIGAA